MVEVFKNLMEHHWFEVLFTAVVSITISAVLIKVVNFLFKMFTRKTNKEDDLYIRFLQRIIECIIVAIGLFIICSKIDFLKTYILSILASSSLLIVVLGFAAQESLSNIINGAFITIFKPFNVGDRIKLVTQGTVGTVEDITLRHTIIRTVENARLLVPNSVMNKEVIENTNFTDENVCYFLDVSVSYDSDIDKARDLIRDLVRNHRYFVDYRTEEEKAEGRDDVRVLVRDLGASGVALRCYVWSKTVSQNFEMCSELRHDILYKFKEEGIVIPYTTVTVLSE